MFIAASMLAGIIPMVIYLIFIWKLDKYEPEPLKYVLQHFLWGSLGAIFLAILAGSIFTSSIYMLTGISITPFFETVMVAPLIEELTKGIFLVKTINSSKFDNVTDGLVYGGAIGLGFGMTENIFYFIAYGDTLSSWISIVLIRSAFSAVMHCIATASMGAFLGIAKYSPKSAKSFYIISGYLLAVGIHFLWNISVSFEETFLLGLLFMVFIIVVFLVTFYFSLAHEKKILQVELVNEIPLQHISFITGKLRFKKGWVNDKIRTKYIQAAVKLAFRKQQLSIISANSEKSDMIKFDIENCREEIRTLLGMVEYNV